MELAYLSASLFANSWMVQYQYSQHLAKDHYSHSQCAALKLKTEISLSNQYQRNPLNRPLPPSPSNLWQHREFKTYRYRLCSLTFQKVTTMNMMKTR